MEHSRGDLQGCRKALPMPERVRVRASASSTLILAFSVHGEGQEERSVADLPDDVSPVTCDRLALDVDPADECESKAEEGNAEHDISATQLPWWRECWVTDLVEECVQMREQALSACTRKHLQKSHIPIEISLYSIKGLLNA